MNYKDFMENQKSKSTKKSKSLSIKTNADFVDAINSYCSKKGISVSGLIIDLLVDFYNNNLYIEDFPSYRMGFGELKNNHYTKKKRNRKKEVKGEEAEESKEKE